MKYLFLFCLTLSALTGCGQPDSHSNTDSSGDASGPPKIVVSTTVLQELTERLVQDDAQVVCLETSLTRQQLTDAQISDLQSASLVVVNGAGLEGWLQTVSLPRSRLLDTTASSSSELLQADGGMTHQHGPNGPKDPAGLIHCTWLSPHILLNQCEAIEERLIALGIDKTQVRARQAANEIRISELTAKIESLRGSRLTVLTSDTETGWLIHELKWKQRVIGVHYRDSAEAATAEQKLKPHERAELLLTTGQQSAATNGGLSVVQMDLCLDSKEGVSLFDRLEGNLNRLAEAVARLPTPKSSETPE